MKTASFFAYQGPGRISIARYPPRGTPGGYRVFKKLAPGPWFNSVTRDEYERRFGEQLRALDPAEVKAELQSLAGDAEPVLLCWEKTPFTEKNWCHRRIVARWLHETLGEPVPERIEREVLEELAFKHANEEQQSMFEGAPVLRLASPLTGGIETMPLTAYTDDELISALPRDVAESLGLR
jgi:hypothetical protein